MKDLALLPKKLTLKNSSVSQYANPQMKNNQIIR